MMRVLPFLSSLRLTSNWSWAGDERRFQRERLVCWKLYFSARMIQSSQVSNFVAPRASHVLERCILLSTVCSCKPECSETPAVSLKSFCMDQRKGIGDSLILGRGGELNKPYTLNTRQKSVLNTNDKRLQHGAEHLTDYSHSTWHE